MCLSGGVFATKTYRDNSRSTIDVCHTFSCFAAHMDVNHSKNFVDPVTGAHTQSVYVTHTHIHTHHNGYAKLYAYAWGRGVSSLLAHYSSDGLSGNLRVMFIYQVLIYLFIDE